MALSMSLKVLEDVGSASQSPICIRIFSKEAHLHQGIYESMLWDHFSVGMPIAFPK